MTLFYSLLLFATVLCSCGRAPTSHFPKDLTQAPDANALIAVGGTVHEVRRQSKTNLVTKTKALLQKAEEKTDSEAERSLFKRMENALTQSSLEVPKSGYDHKACLEDFSVLAFVNMLVPNKIFICRRTASASESRLSQVLIHEAAHLVGVHDECDATRVEVAVMRAAKNRLPFKNGYMEDCGVR